MESLLRSLWHEARTRFGRLPVWLPGTPMNLGDVGVYEDNGFARYTSLDRLGIPFAADVAGEPIDYDYTSQNGAEVSTTLAASSALGPEEMVRGGLEMQIRFARTGAFMLKANSVVTHRIVDLADVNEQILDLYRKNVWRREWVLVTEVARGGPSLTLVSGSNEGEAILSLGAAVAGAPPIGAGFGVKSTKGLAASFMAPTAVTLLWRGKCIHGGRWHSQPWVGERGTEPPGNRSGPHDRDVPGDSRPRDEDWLRSDDGGAPVRLVEIEYPEDLPPET